MTTSERQSVEALLAWYAAMGADEAIGEAPLDGFAQNAAPSPAPERKSIPSATSRHRKASRRPHVARAA